MLPNPVKNSAIPAGRGAAGRTAFSFGTFLLGNKRKVRCQTIPLMPHTPNVKQKLSNTVQYADSQLDFKLGGEDKL